MAVLRLAVPDADTDAEVSDEDVMTERAARQLTNLIRAGVAKVADLLLQSLERRAYHALGYANWEKYIEGEFEFTSRHAYRLVSQAKAMRALAAAPVPPDTRVRIPQVSTRLAAAIGDDYDGVAAAWAERVQTGEKPEEALVEAVAARKAERSKVIPAASRETTTLSDEQIMAMAAELRPRLRAYVESVKAILRFAPKPGSEAQTPEELLDEIHDWVAITGQIVGKPAREPVYELQGEMYRLALALNPRGGERETLSKLAGCSEANIDYHRNG